MISLGGDRRIETVRFVTEQPGRRLAQQLVGLVEIDLAVSTEKPGGIGEAGTPPIAPAVANAWRVLKGAPVRRLPLVRA